MSHTKWFKSGNWDSDMLPDVRTSGKKRTLMRSMTMWIGRQVAWVRPSFTGEAFGRAIPAWKSWKHVLRHILKCLLEIFTDAWILFMLPESFGNPSLTSCCGCSAALLGTCQGSSGSLNWHFGICREHSWMGLWDLAWDTKHSVASSWKMLLQAELELFYLHEGCSISLVDIYPAEWKSPTNWLLVPFVFLISGVKQSPRTTAGNGQAVSSSSSQTSTPCIEGDRILQLLPKAKMRELQKALKWGYWDKMHCRGWLRGAWAARGFALLSTGVTDQPSGARNPLHN